MDDFGTVLARLRRAAGLTQEALARQAGLGPRTVGALERGERSAPQRDTVRRIAAALGASAADARLLAAAARPAAAPDRAAGDGSRPAPAGDLAGPAAESLGRALHQAGRWREAAAEFAAARDAYRRAADADGCCRAHAALARVHVEQGRSDLALAEARAAPLRPDVTDATRAALALAAARAAELGGDAPAAAGYARDAVSRAEAAGEALLLADAQLRYASVCTLAGDLAAARDGFARAAAIAEQRADVTRRVQADIGSAIVLLRTGPVAAARAHAERALAAARQAGDVVRTAAAAVHAAAAAREAGDPAAASRHARLAVRPGYGEESVRTHHGRYLLALLALDDGATGRARALLEPLVDPVRSAADGHTRREAAVLLAAVDLAERDRPAAARRYRELTDAGDVTGLAGPDAVAVLTAVLLADGRATAAVELAGRFLVAADAAGSVLHRIEALRARAAARAAAADAGPDAVPAMAGEDVAAARAAAGEDVAAARAAAGAGGFVLRARLLSATAR